MLNLAPYRTYALETSNDPYPDTFRPASAVAIAAITAANIAYFMVASSAGITLFRFTGLISADGTMPPAPRKSRILYHAGWGIRISRVRFVI